LVEVYNRLKNNKAVAIYPEGSISKDGSIGKFHKGFEMIPRDYDGVIIPYYIEGLFGSIFSKYKKNDKKKLFGRRVVNVYFAQPVPKDTDAQTVRDIIIKMKEENETK